MVYKYKELLELKKQGQKLNFDDISKEQLASLFIDEQIPNKLIAYLYDVDSSKVLYKRRKWDIKVNSIDYIYKNFVSKNKDLFDKLNKDTYEKLMKKENIDWISKALTHYFFRNGPVEDMHANNQLSQSDMKILNKYMVNKIAGLLSLICDGEWLKIGLLLEYLSQYGAEWDKAELDTKEVDLIFNSALGIDK